MSTLREQLKALMAPSTIPFDLRGTTVYIKRLSVLERIDALGETAVDQTDRKAVETRAAHFVTYCVRDAEGNRIYSDEDAAELLNSDNDSFHLLSDACVDHNFPPKDASKN